MGLLSIIVPTLNEQRYLPRLLKSIVSQSFKDYEIIVCDSHSKDDTVKIARTFGCKILAGGSPAAGRNAGARKAKGDLLLFLDADILFPNSSSLHRMISEFERKKLAIATTKITPRSERRIDKFLHEFVHVYFKVLQKIKPSGGGYCILVKKSIHDAIGGFDEKLVFAEDHDYIYRASKKGKFAILDSVRMIVSVRRLDKEGRLNLIRKYALIELYRFANKRIEHKFVPYDMGSFDDFPPKQRLALRQQFKKILEPYKKIVSKVNRR